MLLLTLTRRALRELRSLPAADRQRMVERLEAYAAAPIEAGQNVIPLAGTLNGFRLRVGDWRALFTVGGDEMVVRRIGHRREIYR